MSRSLTGHVPAIVVDACGVAVAIHAPDATVAVRWARQWSRAKSDRPEQEADTSVDVGSVPIGQPPEVLDYALASRVTFAALQQTENTRLSLHGAALADDAGRVLALVAPSGTGKTTASRCLGRVLGYLSDETISVGPDLDVLPYAKPLSVVLDPVDPHRKEQLGPDELGLLVAAQPARLHRLVFLDRSPGPGGLDRVSVAEALSLLVPQTSYVVSREAPLLDLSRLVQACGGAWRLRYAEITDHVDDLVDLLGGSSGETLTAPGGPMIGHQPGDAPSAGPPGTYVRAPWHDAVVVDDEVVVLVERTSYQLAGLGATSWLALDRPRTEVELLTAAEGRHGHHPEGARLLRDAIDSLVAFGIVIGDDRQPDDSGLPLPAEHGAEHGAGRGHDHLDR